MAWWIRCGLPVVLVACAEPVIPPAKAPPEPVSKQPALVQKEADGPTLKVGAVAAWQDAGVVRVTQIAAAERPLKELLIDEYSKARAAQYKPYVMVYSDSCEPCVALRKSFTAPEMAASLRGVYLIQLNDQDWRDGLKSVGMGIQSFPRFHELADNGVATDRLITGQAWEEDVPANMAGPLQVFFRQPPTK